MREPDAHLAQLAHRADDLVGDEVKPAGPRAQGELSADATSAPDGIRAARMSTRSPRKGTSSASSSARWRAPFGTEPSARTTRCQGSRGSSLADSTAPANRGAPGSRSE